MAKKPYVPTCADVLLTMCGSDRDPFIHNLHDVNLDTLRPRVEAFQKLTGINWVANPVERQVDVIDFIKMFAKHRLYVRDGRRAFIRELRQPLGSICGYSLISCRAHSQELEGPFNAGPSYVYLKIRSAMSRIIGSIHFGEVLDVTDHMDYRFSDEVLKH